MADEKDDQVIDDIVGDDDQSDDKQSQDEEKEPTIKELAQTIKALQKGYTTSRQDISAINDNLQAIANSMNASSGATKSDDEYVTVAKLKDVLAEHDEQRIVQQQQGVQKATEELEQTMDEIVDDGVISSSEKQALWNYAASKNETNLFKAAAGFNRLSQESKDRLVAKKIVRQEEGSKVGTSQKSGAGKQAVDWNKIHNTSWDNL